MTILFDIYPAIGHLNASFALSDQLREKQHRVVYSVVEPEHGKMVEEKGFEYILLDYPLESDRQELRVKGVMAFMRECLFSVFSKSREDTFLEKIARWENCINELTPDRVYLDAQCAMRTALYHHLRIPSLLVETMPLFLYDPWVPPFTTGIIPKRTSVSRLKIWLAWGKIVFMKRIRNLFFALILFRQDYLSLYRRLFDKYDFPFNERTDWRRPFIIGIKGVEILSMTPASLDFPRKYPPECQYAPARVDLKREECIVNKRYSQIMQDLCSLKQRCPDTKIIYCFSSTVMGFETRSRIIFKKIRNISLRNPQYIFILSVGKYHNSSYLLPCPSNLYVFQQVPQLHLLSYCDLMITLGGMNSIAECIEKEVPMLVCPLSLKSDQLGNSARVVYHGLGLRAHIRWDSSRTIEKRILRIFENYATFKRNLSEMKAKILAESTVINTGKI